MVSHKKHLYHFFIKWFPIKTTYNISVSYGFPMKTTWMISLSHGMHTHTFVYCLATIRMYMHMINVMLCTVNGTETSSSTCVKTDTATGWCYSRLHIEMSGHSCLRLLLRSLQERKQTKPLNIESLMSCHLLLNLLHELANMILCEALPSIISFLPMNFAPW